MAARRNNHSTLQSQRVGKNISTATINMSGVHVQKEDQFRKSINNIISMDERERVPHFG